ncbi:hypothetical protein [Streptomyces sp. NPDC037389]|uniref:hypothetical protein n=1 Tax=Streptomyces sp. NPDC037389 TaxID=3155369 RepID=UPI0033E01544
MSGKIASAHRAGTDAENLAETEKFSISLLKAAFPDASETTLVGGARALAQTTMAEVREGKPVSKEAIDEAARRLATVFELPEPDLD